MKASGKIGVVCLLVSCTGLQAQQASRPVLRADAALESSSNPHPFTGSHVPIHRQGLMSPAALEQVSDGNVWIQSSALGEPTPANSDRCIQRAEFSDTLSELAEIPGGGLALRNFSLHGEFTRDHMMAMARNFVPSKPLPDAPSYAPMSSREKFDGWARHTYSADMLMGTVFDTLILQATGAYRDYGGGMQGFSKRYGTQLLSNEAGSLFGRWLFPTILHQDTRYYPSGKTNVFDRMAYAASRAVITRSDNGNNVFNSSLLLTLLFTSALANGYKPNYEESFQATMANTFAGLGATAQINLLNEFWPDLKDLFTHHQPGKSISHQVSRDIDRLTSPKKSDAP
jgi:hypothetical protein